jgi:hypothetical protein
MQTIQPNLFGRALDEVGLNHLQVTLQSRCGTSDPGMQTV